ADWGHSCSGGCGGVIEVDPTSGKETLLSANSLAVNAHSQYFDGPTGIALDAKANIIVADESAFGGACVGSDGCGGLIEVNPATGQETKLSANDMPINGSSQLFADPFDVLVVPRTGGVPGPGFAARIVQSSIKRDRKSVG